MSNISLFVTHHGELAILLLMTLESCCIPIPSEVVMPLAGFLAYQHTLNLWSVVLVGTLANLIGSLIAYGIGFYGGRPLIARYGKYVLLHERHLDKAENWFSRYGEVTVFFGRMVPAVRTFVSLPAGIARMRIWRFILFSVAGSIIWNIGMVYAGYELNANWKHFADHVKPFTYVGALIIVIALVAFWLNRSRNRN